MQSEVYKPFFFSILVHCSLQEENRKGEGKDTFVCTVIDFLCPAFFKLYQFPPTAVSDEACYSTKDGSNVLLFLIQAYLRYTFDLPYERRKASSLIK